MEGYRQVQPYRLNIPAGPDFPATGEALRKYVMYHAARHHGWQGLEGTRNNFRLTTFQESRFSLEDGSEVFLSGHVRPNTLLKFDILLIRISRDPRTGAPAWSAFVFPDPEIPEESGEYLDGVGCAQYREDHWIVYEKYGTFGNPALVPEEDRYTRRAKVKYDTKTDSLFYPEAPERD